MVVNNIIRDQSCNSCDVHHNLAKVSNLLPLLSVDDSLDFLIQLCDELRDQEKHNIWSIIQGPDCKYSQGESWDQARDNLAQHKLHLILQWFRSQDLSSPQRVTFILKSLSYINSKAVSLLRDYLSEYKDYTNEKDFEPDATHCPWSGQWLGFSERTGAVDFISRLPVSVSKLILSYVGVNNVWCARLVSKRWYALVKEFVTEQRQFQSHVFRCRALRPALRNVNHTFANKVALCFTPGICTTGHPYVSEEQPGAIKVILEERNVFCGSYHVNNLHKHTDTHRKIHYCRGKYFATGSSDRKIHIRSLETGKLHKSIVGHAGSIRSLLIIEKYGIVISGSYDLTIRAWSLETGSYLRLWRGHRGTITCLDHNEEWLISGARDAMVKVWYLRKSVIKRTLHHDKAILSVKLLGDRAAVGTEGQHLYLWDVSHGTKLKTYTTIGKVNCVTLTPHYIMGGAESVTYIWNMLSLHEDPLFTLPHPGQVLTVQYCYVRCITGCGDGKIRVWSLVSGDCIKVIRGNPRGDPITNLFVDVDRLLINTVSTINSLNFLPVSWDYCSEKFNKDEAAVKSVEKRDTVSVSKRRCKSAVSLRNHVRDRIDKQVMLCDDTDENTPPTPRHIMLIPPHSAPQPPPLPESDSLREPSTPLVPPPSPEHFLTQTTISNAARQQSLFSDEFHRDAGSRCDIQSPRAGFSARGAGFSARGAGFSARGAGFTARGASLSARGEGLISRGELLSPEPPSSPEKGEGHVTQLKNAGEGHVTQLKSVRPTRPSTAPFASKSLSVHGHLPSFVKRRPQTATVIHQRVNVERVDHWQSSWQRLLSEVPESSTEDMTGSQQLDESFKPTNKLKNKHTNKHTNKHPAAAWGQADRSNQSGGSGRVKSSVYRPKTATARIRY